MGGLLVEYTQVLIVARFMQSDPYWACAMAVNVYLVFFRRYDPVRLKRFHWVYILLCYGIPFIPAMFCLFYRDYRGRMYGNATVSVSPVSVNSHFDHRTALVLDRQ